MFTKIIASLALCIIILNTASASETFKWTDAEGHVFYGPKPPKGVAAEKLTLKPIQRYDAQKMLSAYGAEYASKVAESDRKANSGESSNSIALEETPSLPESKQITAAKPQTTEVKGGDVPLVNGDLVIERTLDKVTSCKVPVKNHGTRVASNVSVVFAFVDGTIINGEGPDKIDPLATVEYQIPSEQLSKIPNELFNSTPNVIVARRE